MDGHRRGAQRHYGLTLAVLTLAGLATSVLQTLMTPALPAIQRDLGTSTAAVAWVITVFVLVAAVVTPILGRLGDIFGKERVLFLVLLTVTAGCLVAALSHSLPLLILGRVLQGIGGGFFAIGFGIVRDEFPENRVAFGMGLLSASFGVGGGLGLILSGVIVDHVSYRGLFWLGFAVFLVAAAATRAFVPESPVKTPASIDWLGAGLLGAGLATFLLGVSESSAWGVGSPRVLGLLLGGLAALGVWARWELRVAEPLVDIALARLRGVWTVNAAALLIGFAMYTLLLLLPKLAQAPPRTGYGFGSTVTEAGLFLLPWTAMMAVSAPITGLLANRVGSRVLLITGTLCSATSFTFLAVAHSQRWEILASTALIGLGVGCTQSSTANLIAEAVPHAQVGEALGVSSIARTTGAAVGTQTGAAVLSAGVLVGSFPPEGRFVIGFVMAAIAMAAACGAGLLVPSTRAARAALRLVPDLPPGRSP
jgi:EmrB/QacA subfamily drug resistance transporter